MRNTGSDASFLHPVLSSHSVTRLGPDAAERPTPHQDVRLQPAWQIVSAACNNLDNFGRISRNLLTTWSFGIYVFGARLMDTKVGC